MSVQPLFAEMTPCSSAADSNVRIDVVPTAMTRPPAAFVRRISSAVSSGSW